MIPSTRRVALCTGLGYHVHEWGEAGAPPLVLVHGFLDVGASWRPVVEAGLGAGRRVIALDWRGHGDSDRVGAGGYYYFADYIADLAALLDALDLERVDLAGHSMGGMAAGYFAGTFPGRVRRLALLEGLGPPSSNETTPERLRLWTDAWKKAVTRPAPRGMTLEVASARLMKNDPLATPEAARVAARDGTRLGDDGLYYWKHDPLHLTPSPYPFRVEMAERFWAAITCPVLLVEGAASVFRYAPEELARRRAFFADARHVEIPGAGHMLMRHQPAALACVLQAFFDPAP